MWLRGRYADEGDRRLNWFEPRHLSKIQNVGHKQSNGQHTITRQKVYKRKDLQYTRQIIFQFWIPNFFSNEFDSRVRMKGDTGELPPSNVHMVSRRTVK